MLLRTKLSPLPPQSTLIARPRLVHGLASGLRRKLTLVTAPAGYGKTTLVADWLSQHSFDSLGRASCWLSLDQFDNDPQWFARYLVAMIQTIDQQLGRTANDLLQTMPMSDGHAPSLVNLPRFDGHLHKPL